MISYSSTHGWKKYWKGTQTNRRRSKKVAEAIGKFSANATANCLNNYSALQNALTTNSSAVQSSNMNNPIYNALGQPTTQVVVPGDMTVPSLANPNTNLVLYFNVYNYNPYPPFTNFGDLTSTAVTPVP